MDTDKGERDVVALLESEWVFQHGLPPEAIVAVVRKGADSDALVPGDIWENPAFLRLLSRVIYENVEGCPVLRREAEVQGDGYVYLLDARTPEPGGRVPPEDIIGMVSVSNGGIVPGSFRHNPRHRLLTVNGWFRLPEELEAALQWRIRAKSRP
jgi:hypothetical protein